MLSCRFLPCQAVSGPASLFSPFIPETDPPRRKERLDTSIRGMVSWRRKNTNTHKEALIPMALHVMEEANRCLGCKKPRCQEGCPIHTNIPEVIRLLKANRLNDAG